MPEVGPERLFRITSAGSSCVLQPRIDFSLGLILGVAIALLQSSDELLSLAFYDVEVIVGEFPPLRGILAG